MQQIDRAVRVLEGSNNVIGFPPDGANGSLNDYGAAEVMTAKPWSQSVGTVGLVVLLG